MPAFNTIISSVELASLQQNSADCVVFDCSFDLSQPELGQEQFVESHIARAKYAHLDRDLSAKTPEQRAVNAGRHPLPSPQWFAAWLAARGVGPHTQVVVYDRQNLMFCVRLWWMCQWVGHAACAVLDGGFNAWLGAGGEVASGESALETADLKSFSPGVNVFIDFVATKNVFNNLHSNKQTIIDARAPARFRGEVEPLDPVAGHIPGALNRPFAENFQANGLFKAPGVLRAEFEQLLGSRDAATVVHHCGSGVTATPNLLAMQLAGLGHTKLYAGSWSEWCNTPGLPVARG